MRKSTIYVFIFVFVFIPMILFAQSAKNRIPLKYGAIRLEKRQDEAMKRFRRNRLGAFIHWGLYSIPGGEWKGKMYMGAAEWLKEWAKVSSNEWMSLMEQWNPTDFNAMQWAKMLKEMGVKYVKITTKHHEGFCYGRVNIQSIQWPIHLIEKIYWEQW